MPAKLKTKLAGEPCPGSVVSAKWKKVEFLSQSAGDGACDPADWNGVTPDVRVSAVLLGDQEAPKRCPPGTPCHGDHFRAACLKAVEHTNEHTLPSLAGLPQWEVGLLLKKHLSSSEEIEDEVLEEVTSCCSGIDRGRVNRDLLSFPLSSMPTEAEKAP